MNLFLHFQMVQTSWIFFRNSPQEASGALACRALCNHRQSPVLAGCQNGKAVLARSALHFIETGAQESHAGGHTSCVPAAGNLGPYGSCWARGCFQKKAAVPLILSIWQTSSDRRALCPFSYPFQLPIPALPLSLLLLLHFWEFLSCLRHGEVHWACIDVAVREGEVRVPRAGAGEPESRCTA